MSETADLLFTYLRSVFFDASNAEINIDDIEEDFVLFAKGLMYFAQCIGEHNDFARALARGDLSVVPPTSANELAAPLKTLQANLKHLTWQTQQVAKGDYKQRVDFLGEFADAFNTMVNQLSDRQQMLENEITTSRKHAQAMEMSNILLTELTRHIPEQIFVVSMNEHEVFLSNDLAQEEINKDQKYISKLMELLPADESVYSGSFDIQFEQNNSDRYLVVNTYKIEWHGENSLALIINDVSDEKKQIKELEDFAYRDALTNAFNRFYGLLTLNEWLLAKKRFVLIFVDLDNLKFVNDKYGHGEGDVYITKIAKHLQAFSADTVVCRIGGDEFMLLAPESGYDLAHMRMEELQHIIQTDEYLEGKDMYYSISFGVVALDEKNEMSSSDVLSIADERMYAHKRIRKKERQSGS
ncbi:MAG: diguanylate cyclase [Oscillospiraceae bacterium]|nr:diguanylate cyclase [Oscillospiraceae bacterium]